MQSTRKYLKPEEIYLDAGKIVVLLDLLKRYTDEGRKVLIFSQVCRLFVIDVHSNRQLTTASSLLKSLTSSKRF